MANEETVAWTAAEVWANRGSSGGRISVAQNELLRRLSLQMTRTISYYNEQLSLTGAAAIPAPKGYYIAPERITDTYINTVVIGASVRRMPQGTQKFINRGVLTIYLVNERIEVAQQVSQAWDRADIVSDILSQYNGRVVDPDGRVVWRQLAPLEQEMLPPEYATYSGVSLPYTVVQDPSDNMWT